ncbi:MAG: hypothetical protein KDD63_02525, partial [Bacteroidetes bacterium]|nr:hypothetical protein [Bacteroidota bacterium]
LEGVACTGDVVTRLIIEVQVATGFGTIEVGGNDGAEDRRIKHIPRRSSYRGLTDGRAQAGNGRIEAVIERKSKRLRFHGGDKGHKDQREGDPHREKAGKDKAGK